MFASRRAFKLPSLSPDESAVPQRVFIELFDGPFCDLRYHQKANQTTKGRGFIQENVASPAGIEPAT